MKQLRVYVDTSVIGGPLDVEFAEASHRFFRRLVDGEVLALISTLTAEEVERGPAAVQDYLSRLPATGIERIPIDEEARRLAAVYVAADVLSAASANDALHVAIATVARADVIVSWNFKHLVNFRRIRGFNAVNLREGYPTIEIRSPKELLE